VRNAIATNELEGWTPTVEVVEALVGVAVGTVSAREYADIVRSAAARRRSG
jgi:antitoxin VbhA-like protein